MTARLCCLWALLGMALFPASVTSRAAALAPSETQLNVLFLFADDQRADTIAALGNPLIQTPNLDRLVHNGLAFDRAYMQGGKNAATCIPSRAMLLSGRSLFHVDEQLSADETWPEAFARAGYTTFISGKWHNGQASLPRCFQIARSVMTGGMSDPMHAPLRQLVNGHLTPPQLSQKHACEIIADEAINFLQEVKRGAFMCYLPFDAPHDPHHTPDGFPIHYDPARIPLPASYLPQHPFDNGEMTVRDELLLPWPRTPEAVRGMLADYYRYISYLDSQIGRILDALAASPYAHNTIVVFSADSGVARGSHGLIGKQNLYELDSVRVPLIISGPGIPAGQRTQAMCYLYDVFPTLGKLCGVAPPPASEGADFSATLHDPSKPARSHLIFGYKDVQRAICDDRWKLIRYTEVNRTQLYDLQTDPEEAKNLAPDPDQAPRIAKLTALLQSDLDREGDKAPLTVEHPKPAAWTPPAAR